MQCWLVAGQVEGSFESVQTRTAELPEPLVAAMRAMVAPRLVVGDVEEIRALGRAGAGLKVSSG